TIVTSSPSRPRWRSSPRCWKPSWRERMPRRRKSRIQQRLEYAVYRIVARALRSASDDAVVRWGARLGMLARRVVRGRDRLAMRNLQMVFPEKSDAERRHIIDDCWRHFGREALDSIRTQHLTAEE